MSCKCRLTACRCSWISGLLTTAVDSLLMQSLCSFSSIDASPLVESLSIIARCARLRTGPHGAVLSKRNRVNGPMQQAMMSCSSDNMYNQISVHIEEGAPRAAVLASEACSPLRNGAHPRQQLLWDGILRHTASLQPPSLLRCALLSVTQLRSLRSKGKDAHLCSLWSGLHFDAQGAG